MIVEKIQSYSSLSDTLQATWGFPKPRALRRKVSPLFFAIQGKNTKSTVLPILNFERSGFFFFFPMPKKTVFTNTGACDKIVF